MPYFVSIGRIPTNASGVGRRGYWVRRSGNNVLVKWGAVGMTRTRPTIFFWAGPNLPQTKTHRYSSLKKALNKVRTLKEEKMLFHPDHDYHNYSKLPVGNIIHRYSVKLAARS